MGIYKRKSVYWYEFEFKRQRVRESSRQGSQKKALLLEAEHRARLAAQYKEQEDARMRLSCADVLRCAECEAIFNAAKAVRRDGQVFCGTKCAGQWNKARTMPTLEEFLDDRFIPHAKVTHKAKPKTVAYYRNGVSVLKRSKLAGLPLDELTGEHSGKFAAEFGTLSPSGINMGLRTLRRALNLAFQWGMLEKPVRVELARGEGQRDRVLTTEETDAYFKVCPQPWADAAFLIVEEGLRPGEAFALRWEHVLLGEDGSGLIRVVDGKSRAARRILPMTPGVHAMLKARWEEQDSLAEGWIFATGSKCGHLEVQTAKRQHKTALEKCQVAAFVPYTLRHTALTRLAKAAGGDVFALAKIAGHSSIVVSQKYVHPESETIDEVFRRLTAGKKTGKASKSPPEVPTRKTRTSRLPKSEVSKRLIVRGKMEPMNGFEPLTY
jgi:integrase